MLQAPTQTRVMRIFVPALAGLLLASSAFVSIFDDGFLIGDWPAPAVPVGNEQTLDKMRVGKALFWDEQLSFDRTMSCGTCHVPSAGGDDPRAMQHPAGSPDEDVFGSPGVILQDADGDYVKHPIFGVERQITTRNAPTTVGAAFFKRLFWDARADPDFEDENGNVILTDYAALESLSVEPPVSGVEMGHGDDMQWSEIEAKLPDIEALALATDLTPDFQAVAGQTYGDLFQNAFGSPGITRERVAMVLAQYMRTLVPDQAPIDAGVTSLSASSQRGFHLFNVFQFGEIVTQRCSMCHSTGTNDDIIHLNPDGTFRVPMDNMIAGGHLADALHDKDLVLAKTPTLKNVALMPRLESRGKFAGLEDALQRHFFKDNTGDPQLTFGGDLTPQQKQDVRNFFRDLVDPRVAAETHPFDKPTLYSERVTFQSNHIGAGSSAPGGEVPVIIANAPPKIGNDDFKLGVGLGKGAAPAYLFRGDTATSVVQNGIHWEIDPNTAVLVEIVLLSGDAGAAGEGVGTSHLPIPDDPALQGQTVYFQWLVRDTAAPGGFATSKAAELTYF